MKGAQLRFLLGGDNNIHAEKALKSHKERLKRSKPCVDSSCPQSLHEKLVMSQSPSKRNSKSNEVKERVTKQNYALAKRIFKIMEEPGTIKTAIDDTRHLDSHLGTMNYRHRLEEALLTHKRNLHIAERLAKIKGYYTKKDLYMVDPLGRDKRRVRQKGGCGEKGKTTIVRYVHPILARTTHVPNTRICSGLVEALREAGYEDGEKSSGKSNNDENAPLITSRSDNTNSKSAAYGAFRKGGAAKAKGGLVFVSAKSKAFQKYKFGNILLEYTKIQYGRVLDLVVLKQPFKDMYSVFGVDVSNGNLYENSYSTEDVSNLLDGDCIVTTADNTHVWKMLLNKVAMSNVKAFTSISTTLDQTNSIIINNLLISPNKPSYMQPQPPREETQEQESPPAALVPVAPSISRPSTRARGDVQGSRGRSVRLEGPVSDPLPENDEVFSPEEYPDFTAQFYAADTSAGAATVESEASAADVITASRHSVGGDSIASMSTLCTNATTIVATTSETTHDLALSDNVKATPAPGSPTAGAVKAVEKKRLDEKKGRAVASPLKSPAMMPMKPQAIIAGSTRPSVHRHKAAAGGEGDKKAAAVPAAQKIMTAATADAPREALPEASPALEPTRDPPR